MPELAWTDAQWDLVNRAVSDAFNKTSVASSVLPCYGPLAGSVETVRDPFLAGNVADLQVRDAQTLRLFNLTVRVALSSEQIADESLASALVAFRRAAITLAQTEDDIVFNGVGHQPYEVPVRAAKRAKNATSAAEDEAIRARAERLRTVIASGPAQLEGLAAPTVESVASGRAIEPEVITETGQALVSRVAEAIGVLETRSNPAPYALVLGSAVFRLAHTPEEGSMIMPADRITPMLGGPLVRSGMMDPYGAVVISLGGELVDIVVGTPPRAQFLQVTARARYLFRVYERFVLRVKDRRLIPTVVFKVDRSGV
jgi:uncharacterized linocin/CFP29 family protein